jgi:hypothetical protein
MSDRRGSRFVLEVLFLLALAVALTLSELEPLTIAGVMLVGWVIVALFEWAAWRNEPHYGSGLPPRYYVPRVNLPPAQPLEQLPTYPVTGYPEAREEAPTWIAPAALRAEVLGDWPVALRVEEEDAVEVEDVDAAGGEPEPELQDEGEPQLALEADDPWVVEELPAVPLDEAEPEPEPESEVEPEPEPEPEQPQPVAPLGLVLAQPVQGVARYRLDPLGEPAPKRRFGRGGGGEEPLAVEVPARPTGVRVLPGRSTGEN